MIARLCVVLALVLTGACTTPTFSVRQALPETVRTTTSGQVVGGEGRYGSYAWLGIPFVAPPVGERRWRAPAKPEAWTGVREALRFPSACPQVADELLGHAAPKGSVAGAEDCLALSVWTPRFTQVPAGAARLPVMVWIHGGGNSIGSSAFVEGGHLAAAQNVIVVVIQYRLGPLGWFRNAALREGASVEEQSGNFGTLDQIAALEWVRDNAAAFGGDASNVTIFGESAGGADVLALLMAPRARGLFHRAIVQSGLVPRTPPAFAEVPVDAPSPGHSNSSTEVVARLLVRSGKANDRVEARKMASEWPSSKLAAFLRERSPRELIEAYGKPGAFGMLDAPLLFRDGVVLPAGEGVEPYASRESWAGVPVLIGANRDEMKVFLLGNPSFVKWRLGLLPTLIDESKYLAVAAFTSRAWAAAGVDEPLAAMRSSGAAPTFGYRWDWDEEPTVLGADLSKIVGAAHGLELPFMFGHFYSGRSAERLWTRSTRESRAALSDAMMAYWAEFARTGRPGRGGAGLPEWPEWDPAVEGGARSMILDTPSSGGLRAGDARQDRERMLDDLAKAPDLTADDRCFVVQDIARFFKAGQKAAFLVANGERCSAP